MKHVFSKKALATALTSASLTLPAGLALAQDTAPVPPNPSMTPIQRLRAERQQMRDVREDIREGREELRSELRDVRTNAREGLEELRGNIKGVREEFRDDMRNASTSAERRAIIGEMRDDRREILDGRKASTTAIKAGLKELVRKHIGVATERFRIGINQLTTLTERIASRIEKLKTDGADTAAAETALGLAKSAIATAQADAKAVADLIASFSDSSDQKAAREGIAAAVKKANESMKAAHEALRKTIEALKAIPRPAATTE